MGSTWKYTEGEVEEETVKTASLTCVHTENHERTQSRKYYCGILVHSDYAKGKQQGKLKGNNRET